MKSIFTYPSNPFYVHPDYLGNDTVGWQRRIKDLKDGTYLGWGTATAPSASVDTMMNEIGTYYKGYDVLGEANLSRHNMWSWPLVTQTFETIPIMTVTNLSTVVVGGVMLAVYDIADHRWREGGASDRAHWIDEGYDQPYDYFFDYFTSSQITMVNSDGGRARHPWGMAQNPIKTVSRYDDVLGVPGVQFRAIRDCFSNKQFSDGDVIRLSNTLTSATPASGTINSDSTDYYIKQKTVSSGVASCMEWLAYTDAAMTIPATLTENYIDSVTSVDTITSTTPINLSQLTSSFNAAAQTAITSVKEANYGVQIRLTISVTDPGAGPGLTIASNETNGVLGSTVDYKLQIYAYDDGSGTANFRLQNYWSGSELTITPSQNSGEITYTMQIIDETLLIGDAGEESTVYTPMSQVLSSSTMYRVQELNGSLVPYKRQTVPVVTIPSTQVFVYKDSSNVSQYGAGWSSLINLDGDYSTDLSSYGQIEAGDCTMALNANGQLLVTGHNNAHGGIYDTSETRTFSHAMAQRPSEYVPPSPTPEETAGWQDNFDTNDAWTTTPTGFNNTKRWPNIAYKSAEVTQRTPSVTTQSQNGIKYVRQSGFTTWGMDVSYPPLSYDDFRLLHATSQMTRGQVCTFIFPLKVRVDGDSFIWKPNVTTQRYPYMVSTRDDGRVALLDGWASFEYQVILEGQLINIGATRNGETCTTAVSESNANVFGEAEFRMNYKPNIYTQAVGNSLDATPDSVVVTLAADDFTYTVGPDGLYNVTVSFDMDWYR